MFFTYATAELPVGHNRYKWEERIAAWEKITALKKKYPQLHFLVSVNCIFKT